MCDNDWIEAQQQTGKHENEHLEIQVQKLKYMSTLKTFTQS